jgi:hypothetical protein
MSEERVPEIVLTKKLPQEKGKKSLKIELFPARLWSDKFGPSSPMRGKCQFYSWNRDEFDVDKEHISISSMRHLFFRIRVNGKWFSKSSQYEFYDSECGYIYLRFQEL